MKKKLTTALVLGALFYYGCGGREEPTPIQNRPQIEHNQPPQKSPEEIAKEQRRKEREFQNQQTWARIDSIALSHDVVYALVPVIEADEDRLFEKRSYSNLMTIIGEDGEFINPDKLNYEGPLVLKAYVDNGIDIGKEKEILEDLLSWTKDNANPNTYCNKIDVKSVLDTNSVPNEGLKGIYTLSIIGKDKTTTYKCKINSIDNDFGRRELDLTEIIVTTNGTSRAYNCESAGQEQWNDNKLQFETIINALERMYNDRMKDDLKL